MKKYRLGNRWKSLIQKRSRKAARRKKAILRAKRKEAKIKKSKLISVLIPSPDNLSFIENLIPTVDFFYKIEKSLLSGRTIDLNLSSVVNITGDAILYLLSIISNDHGAQSVTGNIPKNESAKKYLEASGFYKYVKMNFYDYHPLDQNFFSIRRGVLVERDVLIDAINFSIKKSNGSSTVKRLLKDKIFRSLNEGMGNVSEHAYSKIKTRKYWWLMVEYIENTSKLRFYVLDSGRGIASTISKKIRERFLEVLKELFANHSDSDYILSALRGEFRSETKEKHRGYGLPEIREIAENNLISSFTIISNYGYVDVKKMKGTNLSSKIYGSLLTWEIKI